MKPGKTPGVVSVSFNFFKNLMNSALELLTTLFNEIMVNELTSKSWSKIILILFHKNGNVNNPSNYRGTVIVFVIAFLYNLPRFRQTDWQNGYLQTAMCLKPKMASAVVAAA